MKSLKTIIGHLLNETTQQVKLLFFPLTTISMHAFCDVNMKWLESVCRLCVFCINFFVFFFSSLVWECCLCWLCNIGRADWDLKFPFVFYFLLLIHQKRKRSVNKIKNHSKQQYFIIEIFTISSSIKNRTHLMK